MLDWGWKVCFKKDHSHGCWIEASLAGLQRAARDMTANYSEKESKDEYAVIL